MNDELLDVVTADDQVLQTLPRSEVYRQGLQYVRVVEAFIRRPDGRLWIPVRRADKTIAPSGYDIGVGGHVAHGESFQEALAKELSEEIGWQLTEVQWQTLGKYGPADGLNTITVLYEITASDEPALNPDDFVSATWMTPQEVLTSIDAGHPAKSNLAPLIRLTYLQQ